MHCILMLFYCPYLGGVCPMNQFYCGNKTCIPISWACDGVEDCFNGIDETKFCRPCNYVLIENEKETKISKL